jgi:cell wall assembly regulator SMI1
MSKLTTILQEIDHHIADKHPKIKDSLQPPISDQELDILQAALPFQLPPDIVTVLKWHNGQKKNSYTSIFPELMVFSLLNADQILSAYTFLTTDPDIQQPYEKNWLPIMANGGGDYAVLDAESGQIIHYLHDDQARKKLFVSVEELMEEIHWDVEEEPTQ